MHNLSNHLRYQDAIEDIRCVFGPAEERFLRLQADVDKTAARAFEKRGPQDVATFLNEYAQQCTTQVGHAYYELVDYLTLQYLADYREVASPGLPQVAPPVVPDTP